MDLESDIDAGVLYGLKLIGNTQERGSNVWMIGQRR